jgi:L-amino acid N-acyltransferase YncA
MALRARGVALRDFFDKPAGAPTVFGWMPAASLYFDDPDGHLLEVLARLPGKPLPEVGVVPFEQWQQAARLPDGAELAPAGSPAIRAATRDDWREIRRIFQQVIAAGDAFAYDQDTPEEKAKALWIERPSRCWVAVDGERGAGRVLGSYYVRPNQPGRGAHVANAGFMVDTAARGRGVAAALCEHSLDTARQLGFRAMQFNFVVSTNEAAVRAWQRHGFAVVGRIPGAFRHERLGYVDTLVMHREL